MIAVDVRKTFRIGKAYTFRLKACFRSGARRLVLFGPSGSGKTLTLQAVAGLFRPDAGRVEVAERVLFDAAAGICVPARLRRIGYVPQDYALFPHLTVMRNTAFALIGPLGGLSAAAKRTALELLERFEIGHLAARMPHELSGGQRQRAALARALAASPDLLLLDEPFSALDPLLRSRLRRRIRDLLEQWPIPVLLITHDPEDVEVFADEVLLYEGGQVRNVLNRAALRTAGNDLHAALNGSENGS